MAAAVHREAFTIKRCVYTVLTSGYEPLNEQPAARESRLPFICFTDDPGLKSQSWQTRRMTRVFQADDIRNQRTYKLQPHRFLPEFDQSLYIDNSVLLKTPPEQIFDSVLLSSGMAMPIHSLRETVRDEFSVVAADGLDDPVRLAEQLEHYAAVFPEILERKPFWGGFMLRDHRSPRVIAAMDFWLSHVYRYSRRDQLSARIAFHLAGLQPFAIDFDNYESVFHKWPHTPGRKIERRVWRPPGTVAAEALRRETQMRSVEEQLCAALHDFETVQRAYDAVLNATTWRMMAPARRLLQGIHAIIRTGT